MLELPQWFHLLATIATLVVAAAWLTIHFVRISRSRSAQVGCARCEHNVAVGGGQARGVRSKRLRVIE